MGLYLLGFMHTKQLHGQRFSALYDKHAEESAYLSICFLIAAYGSKLCCRALFLNPNMITVPLTQVITVNGRKEDRRSNSEEGERPLFAYGQDCRAEGKDTRNKTQIPFYGTGAPVTLQL